jgi:hypothetical protein
MSAVYKALSTLEIKIKSPIISREILLILGKILVNQLAIAKYLLWKTNMRWLRRSCKILKKRSGSIVLTTRRTIMLVCMIVLLK